MSDEDSNDVVMVESTDDSSKPSSSSTDSENRPLMQLFQRLISNDNKQNTVLTNAQIISILHKEFDIDITTLHELEVDIYLNIVKRFLKDWPKWDEFDQGINSLRKKNAFKSIRKTLEAKYVDLKEFLKIQLEETKPCAQKAISRMIKDNAKNMETVDTSDITLEVYCTRKQLNELILSQPVSGEVENTIFNLTEFIPTSITVNKVPVESILNWFSVQVTLDTKFLYYQRSTNHQIKHVLVNAKNGLKLVARRLKTRIQMKDMSRTTEDVDREVILNYFNKILQSHDIQSGNQRYVLQPLMDIIKTDMDIMGTVKTPATYRQNSNKYPYYRKLKKEVETSMPSASHDLYIEETLAPMHTYYLSKMPNPKSPYLTSFTVECLQCKVKFSGESMYTLLIEHFDMFHTNEPDWNCTNCQKSFNMTLLARNKWHHNCKQKLF